MGIDNETQIKYFNIVIDDNKQYLEQMRKKAEEEGQNDKDKKLSLSSDLHSFSTDEYYFDENDNAIVFSGELISDVGKSYIYMSIPLSDIVLIDILQQAIKKLNKLKTAMEALK